MVDVSVIIPVYNVEEYIRRSIESVLNQTYKNIEVILIDDGSTDNSGIICDEISITDSRVRVMHQENAGIGRARNQGMDLATGKYIFFSDPDDLLKETLLEDTVKQAEEHEAELVIFGHGRMFYPNMDPSFVTTYNTPTLSGVYTGAEFKAQFKEAVLYALTVWTRLYRRDFLERNKIRFTTIKVGEDAEFNLRCFGSDFSRIVFLNESYYFHMIRNDSSMVRYQPDLLFSEQCVAKTLETVANNFENGAEEFKGLITYFKARAINIVLGNMAEESCPLTWQEKLQKLNTMMDTSWIKESISEVSLTYFGRKSERIKIILLKCKMYRLVLLLGEWKKRFISDLAKRKLK